MDVGATLEWSSCACTSSQEAATKRRAPEKGVAQTVWNGRSRGDAGDFHGLVGVFSDVVAVH